MSAEILKTKSRELAYALVRVAYYVKRADLREKIERSAFGLLENAAMAVADAGDKARLNEALKNISALDSLVRLGHLLYEIEPINATILIRELDSLNSAIRQFGNEEKLPDLESFFSNPANPSALVPNAEINSEIRQHLPMTTKPAMIAANVDSDINHSEGSSNGNGIHLAIRQSAVINKIKQGNGGGCRLKDLLAEFPDVSERTLRYDLQRLREQGIIERIGNGGPASYYQVKSGPIMK